MLLFNLFYDSSMTDSVMIELLVLGLLLAVNARLFFMNRGQQDGVVLLSPVALLICVLGYFAWDITLLNGCIFLLALFVFLENLHGVWRFCNKLYVDYFSPLLWLVSMVNILLILGLGALVVIFRPVPDAPDVQVVERVVPLSGSVHSGLTPQSSLFDAVDVMLVQMKPESDNAPWTERGSRVANSLEVDKVVPTLPLVLWVTDGRTSASRVRPVAARLASLGYEVVVADFQCGLFSSFWFRFEGLFFPEEFQKRIPTLGREASFQYGALLDYFGGERALAGRQVFLLGEGYTGQGVLASSLMHTFLQGYFVLNGQDSHGNTNAIPDWMDGFGPVGETAPWINYLLEGGGLLESRDVVHFQSIAAAHQAHTFFSDIRAMGAMPAEGDR